MCKAERPGRNNIDNLPQQNYNHTVPGSPGSPTYLSTNGNAVDQAVIIGAAVLVVAALAPDVDDVANGGEDEQGKFTPEETGTAVLVSGVNGAAPAACLRATAPVAAWLRVVFGGRDGGGGHGEGQSGDDVGEAHFGCWDGNI